MNSAKLQRYSSPVTRARNIRIEDDRLEMERKEVKTRHRSVLDLRSHTKHRQLRLSMYSSMIVILFSFRSVSAAIKPALERGEDSQVLKGD